MKLFESKRKKAIKKNKRPQINVTVSISAVGIYDIHDELEEYFGDIFCDNHDIDDYDGHKKYEKACELWVNEQLAKVSDETLEEFFSQQYDSKENMIGDLMMDRRIFDNDDMEVSVSLSNPLSEIVDKKVVK